MFDWYLDEGYPRYKDSGELVHRRVAHDRIYTPNRHEFPLPFGAYQVHHKDRNKRNFQPENLEIVTAIQHDERHGRFQRKVTIASGGLVASGALSAALVHATIVSGAATAFFWVVLVATGGFGSYLYALVKLRRDDLPKRRRS